MRVYENFQYYLCSVSVNQKYSKIKFIKKKQKKVKIKISPEKIYKKLIKVVTHGVGRGAQSLGGRVIYQCILFFVSFCVMNI